MGFGRIIEINGVDLIGAVSDLPQPRGPCDEARHEMIVAWSPDEMGAQDDGLQSLGCRFADQHLSHGFGFWIGGMKVGWIGDGFIHTLHIATVKNHTW